MPGGQVPCSSCGAVHFVLSVENEEDVQNTGQAGVGPVAAVSPVAHRDEHMLQTMKAGMHDHFFTASISWIRLSFFNWDGGARAPPVVHTTKA